MKVEPSFSIRRIYGSEEAQADLLADAFETGDAHTSRTPSASSHAPRHDRDCPRGRRYPRSALQGIERQGRPKFSTLLAL